MALARPGVLARDNEQARCVIRVWRDHAPSYYSMLPAAVAHPPQGPELRAGRSPRTKGLRYPADAPTIGEIMAVMRCAGDGVHGRRLRG
jgi:hypothetical protein